MSVASLANTTVTIQRRTVAKDGFGAMTETWVKHLRIKLRIQPLSGSDQIRHSREDARITHKAYADGAPDITEGDRWIIDSRQFYVRAARDIDLTGRLLTLEVEERDA